MLKILPKGNFFLAVFISIFAQIIDDPKQEKW